MSTPLVVFGIVTLLLGVYAVANAGWEFEQSLRLRGVDPDTVDARGFRSGVRRNRLVGLVLVVIGAGLVGWGLVV